MKLMIVLSCLAALAAGQGTYPSATDDLDIDAVVSNPESLKAWVDCFLESSPCDKVQEFFKGSFSLVDLSEAIQQACLKCSPAQKVILRKFNAGLKANSPADYALYTKKYDPENKYFGPLEKAVA